MEKVSKQCNRKTAHSTKSAEVQRNRAKMPSGVRESPTNFWRKKRRVYSRRRRNIPQRGDSKMQFMGEKPIHRMRRRNSFLLVQNRSGESQIMFLAFALFACFAHPVGYDYGRASYYGSEQLRRNHGRAMANGRQFNPQAMTAASWEFPLGTIDSGRGNACHGS